MASASQRFTGWLFRNHRWLGIVPAVFVILWGASGVLHPIMSRLSPQPVAMQAPQSPLEMHTALPPSEVLTMAGLKEVASLRVVKLDGASYYQVTATAVTPAEAGVHPANALTNRVARRYFNVNTGEELSDGDVQYAKLLARHFTGDATSPIANATLITEFTDDYLSVNRLLPVYRVDFERDDGLRIYIETSPGRNATLVDNTKATLSAVFQWMHTWSFASNLEAPRKILITVLLALTLASAISGTWIYVFMAKRHTLIAAHAASRRWHRGIAITVALSTLLFTISAVWHLWGSEPRGVPEQLATKMDSAALSLPDSIRHGSWASVNVVSMNDRVYYQVNAVAQGVAVAMDEHAEHNHSARKEGGDRKQPPATLYIDSETGVTLGDASRSHAIALANQYSGMTASNVVGAEPIFKFEGEYGFVNKRLPVWKVSYDTPDHIAYYVETSSGALSTLVRDADRYEGYSFAFLHKYHWLDFAGKNARDILSALFALGIALVAALGIWMFAKRYSKPGAK